MPTLELECAARAEGFDPVAGVDEAGRGPLAGPVVAAAVVLPPGFELPGLDDSKVLSPARRETLYDRLTTHPGVRWSVAESSAERIDEINILQATREAMEAALRGLSVVPALALVDGRAFPRFAFPHRGVVRGDSLSLSIAAASVLAKVTRDRILVAADARYPGYGFAKHKGYGTAEHLAALRERGACPLHRRSFAPVGGAA